MVVHGFFMSSHDHHIAYNILLNLVSRPTAWPDPFPFSGRVSDEEWQNIQMDIKWAVTSWPLSFAVYTLGDDFFLPIKGL